ncbi:hypothetical protein MJO57_19095 [Endozoicomonas sp. SCSIO W0465]|nr:hypothetical protein [Endozoicomonas sp. SCSIO W0465]USE39883.1 hypothetical protein MJO57_19095 [Endozoicomonas sp. SCSIO W0465]
MSTARCQGQDIIAVKIALVNVDAHHHQPFHHQQMPAGGRQRQSVITLMIHMKDINLFQIKTRQNVMLASLCGQHQSVITGVIKMMNISAFPDQTVDFFTLAILCCQTQRGVTVAVPTVNICPSATLDRHYWIVTTRAGSIDSNLWL